MTDKEIEIMIDRKISRAFETLADEMIEFLPSDQYGSEILGIFQRLSEKIKLNLV